MKGGEVGGEGEGSGVKGGGKWEFGTPPPPVHPLIYGHVGHLGHVTRRFCLYFLLTCHEEYS